MSRNFICAGKSGERKAAGGARLPLVSILNNCCHLLSVFQRCSSDGNQVSKWPRPGIDYKIGSSGVVTYNID